MNKTLEKAPRKDENLEGDGIQELHPSSSKRMRLDGLSPSIIDSQTVSFEETHLDATLNVDRSKNVTAKEFLELLKSSFCNEVQKCLSREDGAVNIDQNESIPDEILERVKTIVRQAVKLKYGISELGDLYRKIEKEYIISCRNISKVVVSRLESFHLEIKRELQFLGPSFTELELNDFGKSQYRRITQDSPSIEMLLLIQIGCDKLMKQIKKRNRRIIQKKEKLFTALMPKLVGIYNQEMQRITLNVTDIYDATKLDELHTQLVYDMMCTIRSILEMAFREKTNESFEEKLNKLKVLLEKDYEKYSHQNMSRIKNVQIMNAENEAKSKYREDISDMLFEDPVLLFDSSTSMLKHATYLKQACNMLKNKIMQISLKEPLDGHEESLRVFASNHWYETIKCRIQKDERKHEKSAEFFVVDMDKAKIFNNKNEQLTTSTKILSPMVFQLQSEFIKMGMVIDGKSTVLNNVYMEDSTPFVVGLTKDGDLIYGTLVIESIPKSNIKRHWWLSQLLVHQGDKCIWTEDIQLKNGETHTISIELLIGFVLKNLKSDVEFTLNGICSTAIITVPIWLSSMHRIRINNALKIAGFSNVYLVNESTAAAFACTFGECSHTTHTNNNNNILIVSENGIVIDASLYLPTTPTTTPTTTTTTGSKNLIMLGHSGSYDLKDFYSSNGRKNILEIICQDTLNQNNNDDDNGCVDDFFKIHNIMMLKETNEWGDFFNTFKQNLSKTNTTTTILEETGDVVMYGAMLIGRYSDNIQEIQELIRDKIALDLFCHLHGAPKAVKIFGKETLLPVKNCVISKAFNPAKHRGVTIFQYFQGRRIYVGKLTITRYLPVNYHIRFDLYLNNEGVIKMKNVYLGINEKDEKWEELHSDLYKWETPNLTVQDKERLEALLESLVNSFALTT